jgi:hypothetical protein
MQKIPQVTLQLASIANDSSTSLSRRSAAGNYARKEAALAGKYTVNRRRELKKMERRRREMEEIILLNHVNDPKTTYSLSHSFFSCNGPTQMMRLRQ